MEKHLNEYGFVILDATFFTARFPQELISQFDQINQMYVSGFLQSELDQYTALLTPEQRQFYDYNHDLLLRKVRLISLSPERGCKFPVNIWDTLQKLASAAREHGSRCLLITGNQMLLQRVVMADFPVDIYQLVPYDQSQFLSVEEYPELRPNFHFQANNQIIETPERLRRELTLYTETGAHLHLSAADMEGAEAKLYHVRELPGQLAKVFKYEHVTQQKEQNVKDLKLIGKANIAQWAMFPTELLYWNEDRTKFAGFLQPYIVETERLDNEPLYLGELGDSQMPWDTKISVTVELCLKLVRQVAMLNVYGMYISDFNLANFALYRASALQKKRPYLIMWDVDSFCSRHYQPYSWDEDSAYLLSERMRHHQVTNNVEAFSECTKLLYHRVFRMLTAGEFVLDGQGSFYMAAPKKDGQWKRALVPEPVWNLYEAVFYHKTVEPSVDLLLHALHEAMKQLQEYPNTDLTYRAFKNRGTGVRPKPRKVLERKAVDRSALKSTYAENMVQLPPLMKVQLPYPMVGVSVAMPPEPVMVTKKHYHRIQTRPTMYTSKRRSDRKQRRKARIRKNQMVAWLLVVALSVLLIVLACKEGYCAAFWELIQLVVQNFQ